MAHDASKPAEVAASRTLIAQLQDTVSTASFAANAAMVDWCVKLRALWQIKDNGFGLLHVTQVGTASVSVSRLGDSAAATRRWCQLWTAASGVDGSLGRTQSLHQEIQWNSVTQWHGLTGVVGNQVKQQATRHTCTQAQKRETQCCEERKRPRPAFTTLDVMLQGWERNVQQSHDLIVA